MDQFATELMNLGAVSFIAYLLIRNVLAEKKEDRDLYRQSVETFTEVSKQFAESLKNIDFRVERVEKSNERIEEKLDSIIKEKED